MADPMAQVSDDWQLACVGGIAGARFAGGGIFGYVLWSPKYAIQEKFTFCASGIGMGGNASGFGLDNLDGLSYSPVDLKTPFSLQEIHLSSGKLVSSSVGVSKLSYGDSYIDSSRAYATFFGSFSKGASVGSGAGAFAMIGLWYSFRLNGNSVNPIPAYGQSMMETVNELAGKWTRGVYNLYGAP